MCFGTFDLLHLGHLHYFQQAKKHGSFLIVVVARDGTPRNPRKNTLFSERERCEMARAIRLVDEAVLGNLSDQLKIIVQKKPDVICLGYDHAVKEKSLAAELKARGVNTKIVRAKAYLPQKYKSSKLKKAIFGYS